MNNIHRTVLTAVEQAGLERWDDLFQALRRSCETDLGDTFPQHAVSRWMGHRIAVSAKHHLQVPVELYKKAAGLSGRTSRGCALQRALQHRAAPTRTGELSQSRGENPFSTTAA